MLRRRAAAASLALLIALAVAPAAIAHSELETSTPADGASIDPSLAELVADFSEAIDPARSSLELRGPDGRVVATGAVPAEGPPTRMSISDLPVLASGSYEVRWTTVTPDDGGVERGTFAFTVVEPPPVAASPTAGTSAATAGPSTPAGATPAPAEPTAASPAPGPDAASGTGLADLLVPLLVLAVVVGGGAVLLLRRRR